MQAPVGYPKRNLLRLFLLGALFVLAGTARTGAYDYCGPADTMGAFYMDNTVQDHCCADVDGSGNLYLTDCTRDAMMVYQDGNWTVVYGPGYNCYNVGPRCN